MACRPSWENSTWFLMVVSCQTLSDELMSLRESKKDSRLPSNEALVLWSYVGLEGKEKRKSPSKSVAERK